MAGSETSLVWKNFQVGWSGTQPLYGLPFWHDWGGDARAVQLQWLCFAGTHAVGTAEPGHVRTGSVSCLHAQQQPGLHHTHCNGQPAFRQANPVLLSFVSRCAQTLFRRSASFVRQSSRVNVRLSLTSCFK